MTSGLLVHAVLPTAGLDAVDLTAIAERGRPVDAVSTGSIAALVSVAEEDAVPSRAALLHHAGVVERAFAATTVLPVRFGVVAPSAEDLIDDILVPMTPGLTATLERTAGCDELRLRGRYDEDEVLRAVLERDRRAASLRCRPGTDARIELGERMVRGIAAQRTIDEERAVDGLRPHAVDLRRDEVGRPLDAFALSFLVRRDASDGFEAAVDAHGEASSPLLHLELVGPLPPYSFAAATP